MNFINNSEVCTVCYIISLSMLIIYWEVKSQSDFYWKFMFQFKIEFIYLILIRNKFNKTTDFGTGE